VEVLRAVEFSGGLPGSRSYDAWQIRPKSVENQRGVFSTLFRFNLISVTGDI